MNFLVLIICLLVFLFSLYLLGKDDYFFIRKNFSLENLFDYAFIGLFFGIIFARFLWGFFRSGSEKGFLEHLFSPSDAGITMVAVVLGGMLFIYLISKYRKLPTWRLFDFFSLAFISAFPFGYLGSGLLVKGNEIFYYIVTAIVYLVIGVFFWKVLYRRLISSKLKDGSLGAFFLQVFSLISFVLLFVHQFLNSSLRIDVAYIFLLIIFVGSFIFLLQNEKYFKKIKHK